MKYNNQDINAFRPMLFSIAYNMLGTTSDAEDMVQETYIATIFDISYENCRQHFSRAKKKLML